MYSAKKNDFYLAGYLNAIRSKRKNLRRGTIILIVGFIAIDKFFPNESNTSLYGLTALGLFELFKEIIPAFGIDENLLDRLPEYRMLYVQKFQKLEKLYHSIEQNTIIPSKADKEYFGIKELFDSRIEELDNSIHLPEKSKIKADADKNADTYMNNIYGHLDN